MRAWGRLDRASLREELRTNLWLVPLIEVVAALVLFALTYALDRAAFDGDFRIPSWALSGSPDASRQILTTIAAAIITVVGVVFSIVIVALTLASTQFGPRMLRNFIRDRGTQVTLGTFVATFVYAMLALGAIGQESRGNFVPHISITVTLVLLVVDLGVLIYFIHHIATQIQLPQVIAGIAGDLAKAIETQAGNAAATKAAPSAAATLAALAQAGGAGGAVAAPRSGYLQSIDRRTLVRIATDADVVIQMLHRPGHFLVQGHPYATVWPAAKAEVVARELGRSHLTGPYRTLVQDVSFGLDQLVEIGLRALSAAVNDTFTAITCIDWIGDSLFKVTGNWQPRHSYRDGDGQGAGDHDRADLRAAGGAVVREAKAGQRGHAGDHDPAARRARQDHAAGRGGGRPGVSRRAGGDDRPAGARLRSARPLIWPTFSGPTRPCLRCAAGGQSIGAVTDRGLDASR